MKVRYRLLSIELGFFFGWSLTVPLFGPFLQRFTELRGALAQPQVFMLVHALALLGLGFVLNAHRQQLNDQKLVRCSLLLCALFTVGLLWMPLGYENAWLALMALPSSLYVLLWVTRFSAVPRPDRPRIMVWTIVISNVIYGVALLINASLGLLGLTLLPLALLLVPAYLPGSLVRESVDASRLVRDDGVTWPTLMKFCLAVLAFYVVGGLYYSVTLSAMEPSSTWGHLLLVLPYVAALGLALFIIDKLGLRPLAIFSAALLGIGYVLSALPGFAGSMVMAFFLIQAALAGFDMFVWVGLAEYHLKRATPVVAYGWGLGANVAGLLLGSLLASYWLSMTPSDMVTNSALAATLVLFLSILALVELPLRPQGATAKEPVSGMNGSKSTVLLPAHLAEHLTSRQLEVANLMLQGLDNKDIEQALFITANTTKSHIRQVYRRLHVHSRQELLLLALQEQESHHASHQ